MTSNLLSIKATVVTAEGARVQMTLVCPSRRVADDLIEATYPDHRAAFITVRRSTRGGAAC